MILVQDVCNTEWHDVIVSYKQYYCNVYHLKTSYVYEEMFHKNPEACDILMMFLIHKNVSDICYMNHSLREKLQQNIVDVQSLVEHY